MRGEQIDIRNSESFHNISSIHFLAVNGDVKFKIGLFVWFVQDGLNLKKKPKHCVKYIQCIIRVFLSLPCKVIQHWQGKAKLSTSCEADQEDHPFNSGFCATASFSCPLGWEATLSSVTPKLKYFSRAFRSFYGYAIKHLSGERLLKQFPVTEGKMSGATNSGMIDRQIALYCYTVHSSRYVKFRKISNHFQKLSENVLLRSFS